MEIVIFGVPTNFSPWTLLLAGIFLLDSYLYIKKMFPKDGPWRYVLAGFIVSLFTVLAIVVHEFSHGLAATFFNVDIVGAGTSWWGAYVEPAHDAYSSASPMTTALIALAGPLSNIVLGLLAAIPVYFLRESLLENSVQYFSYINLRLAIWNLFPFLILDGAKFVNGVCEAVFPADIQLPATIVVSILFFAVLYYANTATQKWLKEL